MSKSIPKSIEVKLMEPVLVDGKETDTLVMNGPKVRDLMAAEKAGGGVSGQEVWLFAALCQVDQSAIENMVLADYKSMQKAYQRFLS